jgi:hypothetical protein
MRKSITALKSLFTSHLSEEDMFQSLGRKEDCIAYSSGKSQEFCSKSRVVTDNEERE